MRPALPTPRIKTTEVVLIGLLVLMVAAAGAAKLRSTNAMRANAITALREFIALEESRPPDPEGQQ